MRFKQAIKRLLPDKCIYLYRVVQVFPEFVLSYLKLKRKKFPVFTILSDK